MQANPFSYRGDTELMAWLKTETSRLRITLTEGINLALEHWRATIETNGDAKWLPGYVPPVPELVEYCQLPECGHAPVPNGIDLTLEVLTRNHKPTSEETS